MSGTEDLLRNFHAGDKKALARIISLVENEAGESGDLLASLKFRDVPIIGITGPPGAGKSTLINSLIKHFSAQKKSTGILAIDPTSPFNYGSLLGDRLRMAEHFTDERVFIRSLATRGSLGGLSAKTLEVCDVMRAFGFDRIIIETVGVGQSEVEVAGLADVTVLVLVPESGDEVQTMKSGIMEIADVFVVNKADREGADLFAKNLVALSHGNIPVIQAVASAGKGTEELIAAIEKHGKDKSPDKKTFLLAEKAYRFIQEKRMKDIRKADLQKMIGKEMKKRGFNLYAFIKQF